MKIFKKAISAIAVASLLMSGCLSAISSSAVIVDDNNAGASKNWNVRHIGNGAPSSEDISNRFYVFYSSGGHKGKCTSITSHDTTFSVVASCISNHSVSNQIWNGNGTKSWTPSQASGHVRYLVYSTGYWTESKGTIWRV